MITSLFFGMVRLLKVKKIVVTLFLGLFLWACEDKKENQLIVATSADYPPFEFFKDGEIVGFEADLIRAIASEMKTSILLKDMSFDTIIGALQTGRIDLAISAISSTPERAEKTDFSIPYHKSMTVILVSSDSPLTKIEDLSGKTIGVQMGTTYEQTIKKEWQKVIPGIGLRSLSKIPDLIQDFKSGRLDAIVLGIGEGKTIVKFHPDFKLIPLPQTEVFYAVALPKNSPLTDKINGIIKKFQEDGTLKKLEEKWMKKEE